MLQAMRARRALPFPCWGSCHEEHRLARLRLRSGGLEKWPSALGACVPERMLQMESAGIEQGGWIEQVRENEMRTVRRVEVVKKAMAEAAFWLCANSLQVAALSAQFANGARAIYFLVVPGSYSLRIS